jgi:hypothetical protein
MRRKGRAAVVCGTSTRSSMGFGESAGIIGAAARRRAAHMKGKKMNPDWRRRVYLMLGQE